MWLTFVDGERAGQSVEVGGDVFTIGRSAASDLSIRETQLSRRHAALRRHPEGTFAVEDLGSKNGTFVNDVRITSPVTLSGGETLQVGESKLSVSYQPREAETSGPEIAGGAVAAQQGPPAQGAVPSPRGEKPPTPSMIHRLRVERSVRRNAIIASVALGLAVVFGVLSLAGVLFGGDEKKDVGAVVAAAEPSTALILQRGAQGPLQGAGTGWVLDADEGLVVTNNHVINGARTLAVGVGDDRRRAELVATAPCEDIAVVRVTDTDALKTMPLITRQADIEQGQTVVALGYPDNAALKDELTATQGVVSVVSTSYNDVGIDTPRFKNVVQTDAAINPGNSGGPLVDLDSELVGMNTAVRTETAGRDRLIQGQGYAIGVDRLRQSLPGLRRGDSIGWSGFRSFDPVPGKGVNLADPAPGTDAAEVFGPDGELGVVAIDETPMDGSLERYCAAMADKRKGDTVTLTALAGKRRVRGPLRLP